VISCEVKDETELYSIRLVIRNTRRMHSGFQSHTTYHPFSNAHIADSNTAQPHAAHLDALTDGASTAIPNAPPDEHTPGGSCGYIFYFAGWLFYSFTA
jgi:hypothetical protein